MFEKYLDIILNTPLFDNLTQDDAKDLLSCMNAHSETFPKESFIFLAGNVPSGIGIMLTGKAKIIKEDIYGNLSVIDSLEAGDIFGEVFACAMIDEIPVTVEADTECEVLLMDYQKVITSCSTNCVFHSMLIKNMLKILAQKNMFLNNKNDILTSRTTREKIMKFLENMAAQRDQLSFDIPFDRQELADFLGLNRSAMTREMLKMKEDGLIDFNKNHFKLLN